MNYLGTDILAQEAYFKALTDADPGLQGFVFESGEEISRLYEAVQQSDFNYPALVLFMPGIEMEDDAYGLIEAEQDNAFAILVKPADNSASDRNEAIKTAQLAAFRVIKQLRKDARSGRFELPLKRRWRIRPMSNVGPGRACGVLVDFKIITNANALVGSDD